MFLRRRRRRAFRAGARAYGELLQFTECGGGLGTLLRSESQLGKGDEGNVHGSRPGAFDLLGEPGRLLLCDVDTDVGVQQVPRQSNGLRSSGGPPFRPSAKKSLGMEASAWKASARLDCCRIARLWRMACGTLSIEVYRGVYRKSRRLKQRVRAGAEQRKAGPLRG